MKRLILSMFVCMTLVVGLAVQGFATPVTLDNGKVSFDIDATGVVKAVLGSNSMAINYTYAVYFDELNTALWLGANPKVVDYKTGAVAMTGSTWRVDTGAGRRAVVTGYWTTPDSTLAYLEAAFTLNDNADYLETHAAFEIASGVASQAHNVKGYWVLTTPSPSDAWQAKDETAKFSTLDMVNNQPANTSRKVVSTIIPGTGVEASFFADAVDDYQVGDDVIARINAGNNLASADVPPTPAINNPSNVAAVLDPATGVALTNVPGLAGQGFRSNSRLELNVVPEPCTMGLLATGLIGLIGMRRRRQA